MANDSDCSSKHWDCIEIDKCVTEMSVEDLCATKVFFHFKVIFSLTSRTCFTLVRQPGIHYSAELAETMQINCLAQGHNIFH